MKKLIATIFCVLAVLQLSIGQTATLKRSATHLTAVSGPTTTHIATVTGYIATIVVTVTTVGSGGVPALTIVNKEGTPKTLVYVSTAALGTSSFHWGQNTTTSSATVSGATQLMTSGIDIVNAGTTTAVVDVFIDYY